MRNRWILIVAILSGCATVPDVTLYYYHAKWSTTANVIQTVGCGPDKSRLIIAAAASVSTTYTSDTNSAQPIRVKDISRWYADSELTMEFTEDGRLKSVNQSTTGQGEAIVKSAVALLTTPGLHLLASIPDSAAACARVEALGGSKPITLTYKAEINSVPQTGLSLDATGDTVVIHNDLKNYLPKYTLDASTATKGENAPSFAGSTTGVVNLTLQKIGQTDLTIKRDGQTIGTSRVIIPLADTYTLPIQRAQFFGKQSLALSLADSGAISKITYGRVSGTAPALNALGSIATGESATTKAAELKAEADVIAQQQRLVLCQTKPADCK